MGRRPASTPPPVDRRMVDIPQAAQHIGCSTKTIRRAISRGSITGYRLGPRSIRVDLNEVEQLLRVIPTVAGNRVAS